MTQQLTVRTSESGWLSKLAKAYKDKTPALIIDDANVGIDPINQTLFDMARTSDISTREIVAVCASCGMSLVGAGMVVLASFDPEPTSKLALLVGSGVMLAATGGWSAIQILTGHKPPNIKFGIEGVEISWA